ncbi:reverse transcriptase domain-containing protein [Tanacetum coccineum]
MKKLIAKWPMLTAPKEKEELVIYLAAAKEAISSVLMTERDGKQMPIYFVSRALQGPKINYTPMEKLILSLILADFIVERPEDDPPDTPMEDKEELPDPWILFTDGSSCIDGSGAGLIITNPEGIEFTYALRFRFDATNNKAEYEALIAGLRIAEQMGKNSWKINEKEVLAVVEEEGRTWMTPIYKYATEDILPEDKRKARAIRRKAGRYAVTNRILYKSMHVGPRYVVAKDLRSGYYWPTMHVDAEKLIRECKSCQVHRPVQRNPQQNLTHITSLWPFYKWGIDIAGPFLKGLDKVKFLIVAIDYFTKWIEAKPVATITGAQIKKFMWDNIVCKFGLPREIISDNGNIWSTEEIISDNRKQFRDNPFKDWCKKLCICQCFTSIKHMQANGLVERANRSLGEGIKSRLDERSKNWLEEISHVLWVHRTMIKSNNGETPFSLTYGMDVVIPVKIGMPTLITVKVDMIKNDKALEINLDLLEEKREQVAIQEAKSKAMMEKIL